MGVRRLVSVGTTVVLLAGLLGAGAARAAAPTSAEQPSAGYEAQIVGGRDAPATWTFIAALIAPGQVNDYQGQFCGGALIEPTWVLTAAHCAELFADRPSALRLLIGRRDLLGTGGDDITAKSIRIHPGWGGEIGEADVALIELSRPSSQARLPLMDKSVEPVFNDEDYTGFAAGWGRLTPSGNQYPIFLQSAELYLWSDSFCRSFFGSSYTPARHLCAGSSSTTACVGDSGGPLLVPDVNGVMRITGVVSFGPEVCGAVPGVFNQVSWFRSWIDPIVGSSATTTTTTTTAPPTTTTTVPSTTTTTAPPTPTPTPSSNSGAGYWMLQGDGGVVTFGRAGYHGGYPNTCWHQAPLCNRAIDLEPTPSGAGYWTVTAAGDIAAFGDAVELADGTPAGSAAGIRSTPSGQGAWVFGPDGCVLARGDAADHGSMCGQRLTGAVIGMTPTPTGKGYWLLGSDGGIFAFGDAAFHGSTGAMTLNRPIVAMASTPTGNGYWLVGADGGIFAFGDARFFGSTGAMTLNRPIIGILPSSTGAGYHLVGSDGGIFSFGTAAFHGSLGATPPPSGVLDAAVIP